MNFEKYIRDHNNKGVNSFLVSIRRQERFSVRALLKPFVKDLEDSHEILIKENTIGWHGEMFDLVGEKTKEYSESADHKKMVADIDDWFENENKYLKQIFFQGFIILQKNGTEALKQYLKQIDVDVLPGTNFKI